MIIGNGVAAVAAVAGIRSADDRGPITLIAREPHHTYSKPLISYLLGGVVEEEQLLYRPRDFYRSNGVSPLLGLEVARVDPGRGIVETTDGEERSFGRLLIATGGVPIVPPDVEAADATGVFTLTTLEDARNIKGYIEARGLEEALVVGGGLIGMKSTEALVELGIRTTVVELADRILSTTFDRTAGELALRQLREAGVTVHCGTTVRRIRTRKGEVDGAVLRDGTRLSCRLVIFAIGVVPNVDIVRGTDVQTDRGILVDETMQTSVGGIYAAGDVAQADDLLGAGKRAIPIFPDAFRQGLVAGSNMAGRRRLYRGGIPMNSVDIFGLPTISVGLTDPEGGGYEVLTALDEGEPSYRKIVLQNNKVVGAIFIGCIDRAGIVTGLIREQVDVSDFKDALPTEDFGLISLPRVYRKHVVSGMGIEV
jgi:NAD(P)H-nitrite reductase large subunit